MIQNKRITITKQNQFDRGWTIFTPYQMANRKNREYKPLLISDIVRAITKSDKVCIILSEACLASAIVKELEWVSKYSSIELIAQNEAILSRYSAILFSAVKVDPDVSFNYLSIKGSRPLSVLIENGYTETSSLLKEVCFDGCHATSYDSLLSDFSEIMCIGGCFAEYDELCKTSLEKGIRTFWVIDQDEYSKDVFDKFNNTKTLMLLSARTKDAIIGFSKSGAIKKIVKVKNGLLIPCPIEAIDEYVGELYLCAWQGKERAIEDVEGRKSIYTWINQKIEPFAREEKLVIKRTVQTGTMHDFLSENFDASEAEDHNQYSAVAKRVEYVFELLPPTLPKNCRYSSIYIPLIHCLEEWRSARTPLVEQWKDFLSDVMGSSALSRICDGFAVRDAWIEEMFTRYDFTNFSSKASELKVFLEDAANNLLNCLGEIYSSLGTRGEGGRFDKFDTEIAGYQQTIAEKQALIARGIDVLSNKRRVEILQKKISDLLVLKAKFENDAEARTDKMLALFLKRCEGYLRGEARKENEDSLVNVIKAREDSKETLLELFASDHLYPLSEYIKACLCVVEKMCAIDIPDDYTVYEADGVRMIVIGGAEEFYKTREIQEKYQLNCVVRR